MPKKTELVDTINSLNERMESLEKQNKKDLDDMREFIIKTILAQEQKLKL